MGDLRVPPFCLKIPMYFCLLTLPQLKITVAKIVERRPKNVDKDGFELRYLCALNGHGVRGAEIVINDLDVHFGDRTKAVGVYQVPYEKVHSRLQIILNNAPQPWYRKMPVRIAAGIAAAALMVAMGFVATAVTIGWLAICAFKKQSGLLTMAETAVVWKIFDWRPMIQRLTRIALGR